LFSIQVIDSVTPWLKNIPPYLKTIIQQIVNDIVDELYSEIYDNTPMKTGETRKSLRKEVSGNKGIVYSDSIIYVFLEYGTSPHDIFPRKAQVLHWIDESGEHFAKHVHHPGTKPLAIWRNALFNVKRRIGKIVKIRISQLR